MFINNDYVRIKGREKGVCIKMPNTHEAKEEIRVRTGVANQLKYREQPLKCPLRLIIG